MIKETIICIVIVIMIFTLDVVTQKYTEKSVETMTTLLSNLKTEISKQDIESAKTKIQEIDYNWHNMHDKLAYYIEHDELEKVDSAIIQMNSYVESKDFSSAMAQLEEGKFVLEHIQEKTAFNLKNIF